MVLSIAFINASKVDLNVLLRVCSLGKINSVALVEDSGGYSGVLTAAHEVATCCMIVLLLDIMIV